MRDAAVWGTGTVAGYPVVICVMDFGFMGGSMGAVVGEKVARAARPRSKPGPRSWSSRPAVGRGCRRGPSP